LTRLDRTPDNPSHRARPTNKLRITSALALSTLATTALAAALAPPNASSPPAEPMPVIAYWSTPASDDLVEATDLVNRLRTYYSAHYEQRHPLRVSVNELGQRRGERPTAHWSTQYESLSERLQMEGEAEADDGIHGEFDVEDFVFATSSPWVGRTSTTRRSRSGG
jgi:hypothetical protein